MKGYVKVKENTERYVSCNCCSSREGASKLWDVEFVFNNYTHLIKVCEEHLKQLKTEIDNVFNE